MLIDTDKLIKLDLACGSNKIASDFIGVDCSGFNTQADYVMDLEWYPWKFDNDSIDEIYCSHFIEHVSDLNKFMNEVYRILKKGCKAKFISPYYTSIRAWQDPTHKRAISEKLFEYYTRDFRIKAGVAHYPINTDFSIKSINFSVEDDYKNLDSEEFEYQKNHFWNVVRDIEVTLVKK